MKEEILTAKEWLEKENLTNYSQFPLDKNGVAISTNDLMERYANYKSKILTNKYDEYLEFLNKCNEAPISNAYVHGWRESKENIEKGVKFRKEIEILNNC